MHGRALSTTLFAGMLTVIAGGSASAAHAAPPSETTTTFLDTLACQSDPEQFQFTLVTRDRLHERETPDRYHESSGSVGTFTAVPVHLDEQTDVVTRRVGQTWTGRVLMIHTANDGTAGAGHAVSTFRIHISATSDSGERLHQQGSAHYAGTARPEDAFALVRHFSTTSSCR